jgi:hypothetical protein
VVKQWLLNSGLFEIIQCAKSVASTRSVLRAIREMAKDYCSLLDRFVEGRTEEEAEELAERVLRKHTLMMPAVGR